MGAPPGSLTSRRADPRSAPRFVPTERSMSMPSLRRRAARLRQLVFPFIVAEAPPRAAVQAGDPAHDRPGGRADLPGHPVGRSPLGIDRRLGGRDLRRLPPDLAVRAERDESWRTFRLSSIERTRPQVERFFRESDPAFQKLMRYAGMDPEHGLLRWGNYNWTLLLSSKVFEPDDAVSYRMRPGAAIDLADEPEVSRHWRRRVLPRAGRPGAGRGHPRHDGGPAGIVAADDQLLGPARPRAGARRAASRDGPGRLLHAGDVHRRRRDAAGAPSPLPASGS